MTSQLSWPGRRYRRLLVFQLAAVAVVVAAGRMTATRAAVGDQALGLSLAVVAAVAAGVGSGLWLASLSRAAGLRRRMLLARLDAGAGAGAVTPPEEGALVAVPGMTLAHRPDCPLVAGKRVEPVGAGGEPCGWCRP